MLSNLCCALVSPSISGHTKQLCKCNEHQYGSEVCLSVIKIQGGHLLFDRSKKYVFTTSICQIFNAKITHHYE